ncbi:MAG: hypothetical protein Q4C48_00205 [Lachnospiraceae bacterium]|nr:hypothetical protein [Lachnospiraceae bacterium]
MKKRFITISVICCAIITVVVGIIAVQKYMRKAEMSAEYQVVSFASEEEMIATISGSWVRTYHLSGGTSESYLNFNDYVCSEWSSTSDVETKSYTLDYQNGRIVFDTGYYYDIVIYKEKTYVRITPNAKQEEYYFLFKNSNKSVPE